MEKTVWNIYAEIEAELIEISSVVEQTIDRFKESEDSQNVEPCEPVCDALTA
jgi:hypothetical protein